MSHRLVRGTPLHAGALPLVLLCLVVSAATAAAQAGIETYRNYGSADRGRLEANLVAAGYTPAQARLQADVLGPADKTIRQVQTTLFLGEDRDLASGTYQCAGLIRFTENRNDDLLYTAFYRKNKLEKVDLSDQRILTFIKGSVNDFNVTLRSADKQREYVAEYREGMRRAVLNIAKFDSPQGTAVTLPDLVKGPVLHRSVLRLKDIGATFWYDAAGNLTSEGAKVLMAPATGYTYYWIPPRRPAALDKPEGFVIKGTAIAREERYSPAGRRMVVTPAIEGQREVLEQDVQQSVTLKIARFNDPQGVTVTLANVFKEYSEVYLSREGKMSRVTVRTRELCDAPELVREEAIEVNGGKELRWKPLPRPDFAKLVTALRFYEGDVDGVPRDKRVYKSTFAHADTRYVHWQVDITHPDPGWRIDYRINAVWLREDGTEYARDTTDGYLEPRWASSSTTRGRGGKPGNWPAGKYTVQLQVDGRTIASGSFVVE